MNDAGEEATEPGDAQAEWPCLTCGTANPADALRCWKCGRQPEGGQAIVEQNAGGAAASSESAISLRRPRSRPALLTAGIVIGALIGVGTVTYVRTRGNQTLSARARPSEAPSRNESRTLSPRPDRPPGASGGASSPGGHPGEITTFADDFEDETVTWYRWAVITQSWRVATEGNGHVLEGGGFESRLPDAAPTGRGAVILADSGRAYCLEGLVVRVSVKPSVGGGLCWGFRSPRGQRTRSYFAVVMLDGVEVWYQGDRGRQGVVRAQYDFKPKQWYDLELRCAGGEWAISAGPRSGDLRPLAQGRLSRETYAVRAGQDGRGAGAVGLGVANDATYYAMAFDDFRLEGRPWVTF